MREFKCGLCGYIFSEAVGLPEKNIPPGTKWEDIPDSFVCPLCGAPKAVFEEVKAKKETAKKVESKPVMQKVEKVGEYTPEIISIIFSNLAKGCEKQRLFEEMDLFNDLSLFFKENGTAGDSVDFNDSLAMLEDDLSTKFPTAKNISQGVGDRGALRALTWSEKVSMIDSTLVSGYLNDKESMEDTDLYVCEICGFVYSGQDLPDNCPICKVPKFKITKMERR